MKQSIRNVIFFGINYSLDEWCPNDDCKELLFESGDLYDSCIRITTYQTKTKLKEVFTSSSWDEIESEIDIEQAATKFFKNTNVSFDKSKDSLVCDSCGEELHVRHDERLITDSVFER
jgi:hypothetical protein